jgi:hypothetical protein
MELPQTSACLRACEGGRDGNKKKKKKKKRSKGREQLTGASGGRCATFRLTRAKREGDKRRRCRDPFVPCSFIPFTHSFVACPSFRSVVHCIPVPPAPPSIHSLPHNSQDKKDSQYKDNSIKRERFETGGTDRTFSLFPHSSTLSLFRLNEPSSPRRSLHGFDSCLQCRPRLIPRESTIEKYIPSPRGIVPWSTYAARAQHRRTMVDREPTTTRFSLRQEE